MVTHDETVLEDGSRTESRIGAVYIHIPPHTSGPPQHWDQVCHSRLPFRLFPTSDYLTEDCASLLQMHDETFLVTSGSIRITTRDMEIDAREGDYIVVPPLAPHTFANVSDREATMYSSFTPGFYVNYFRYIRDEAEKNGGAVTREVSAEAMRRYATIQVGKQ